MKIIQNLFLFLITCYCFTSCSYNFQDDYKSGVKEVSTTDNIIDIKDLINLDTLNVETQIKYTFNGSPNQTRINSEVFLNSNNIGTVWNYQNNSGLFTIKPSNYSDGIHELKISHQYRSGSGSLADQVGLELLQKTETIQFVINRNPSNPPSITAVNIVNGSIEIDWTPPINYLDYNQAFLSLQFNRREVRVELTPEELALGKFTDTTTVLFTGNSNTANYDDFSRVIYSIIFTSDFTELAGGNMSLEYDMSWMDFNISYVEGNESYKVKWSSHPLYSNFDNFDFNIDANRFQGSSNGGEFVINSPYAFGKAYIGNIKPLSPNYTLPNFAVFEMNLDPETFGLFDFNSLFSKNIIYNPNNGNYYALVIEDKTAEGYLCFIYEYSNEMVFIRKKFITISQRLTGHRLINLVLNPVTNNLHLDTNYRSHIIDKTSLNIISSHQDVGDFSSRSSVRGNILSKWDLTTQNLTLTNLNTNEVIFSVSESINQAILSNDGKYMYLKPRFGFHSIYRISNSGAEAIKLLDLIDKITFSGDTAFYRVNSNVFIVDLNTDATKTFSYGNFQNPLQYDPISQKLIMRNAVYDLNTEEIKELNPELNKSTTGIFNSEDRSYYLTLKNGRLFHSKGIYIDNF